MESQVTEGQSLELPPEEKKLLRKNLVEEIFKKVFPDSGIQKILFVIPPDGDASLFNLATAKRKRYWSYPPYGVGVLATVLRNMDLEVEILNLNNEVLKAANDDAEFDFDKTTAVAIEKMIQGFRPDFIGMSCMFSQTHQSAMKITSLLRQSAPEVALGIGGVHPTNSLANQNVYKSFIEDFRDIEFVFTYESEVSFQNFVKVVNKDIPTEMIGQVCFNPRQDRVKNVLSDHGVQDDRLLNFEHKVTPSEEDLNVIPAFDLMKIGELSDYGKIGSFFCFKENDAKFATSIANRGCRARCTFCSVRNFNGLGVRGRDVQSIIDELKVLENDYGVSHIMWLDDDFLFDRKKSMLLFNEMVKQNVGLTWDCTNGVIASSCTDEMIDAASKAGCIGLTIGMESGNNKILREIRKPGNAQTFLRAAEVLRKYENIVSRVFVMIGFPNESYNMILDTIKVAQEMDLDWYNITMLQPLPNTPIFDAMVAEGLIEDVNFTEIRYNSGAYGKQRTDVEKKVKKTNDLLANDFKNAFSGKDLDAVPQKHELDDIWAYMNYHINFRRLFHEKRPVKLKQQLQYVENISDLVAPENAFAMYFAGFLQKQVYGKVNTDYIKKLEHRLSESPYWLDRFNDFGLSIDHMKSEVFPQQVQ